MTLPPSITGPMLRQYRRALALRQKEFGEALGVSQAAISLAEAGRMPLSDGLRQSLVDRFDRDDVSPRLSEFLAQLQEEAPPRLAQHASATIPVYAWSPSFDPFADAVGPAIDLVTLRLSAPAIALAMPNATREWLAGEILVFAICEPPACAPDDLVLLQPAKRPRNASSIIAVVERVRGRSSAHRRFVPVQPSGQALSADADSVEFIARCVYRARYTAGTTH
jgi:transcriptional regulator with XRE-family HTH domain